MYLNAKTPEDVVVLLDEVDYIDDVTQLSNLASVKKNIVKEKITDCPMDNTIKLKDLSLMPKGMDEDMAFSLDPELLKNIRRGNTIIMIGEEQQLIGRKGLNKFFDLYIEYVQPETRYDESKLDKVKLNLKNFILAPVLKTILEGKQVEVLKTLKANGENA